MRMLLQVRPAQATLLPARPPHPICCATRQAVSIYQDRRLLIPFRSTLLPQIFTDVLVIGTGVAGLRTALEAAAHGDVILLDKEAVDLSTPSWAGALLPCWMRVTWQFSCTTRWRLALACASQRRCARWWRAGPLRSARCWSGACAWTRRLMALRLWGWRAATAPRASLHRWRRRHELARCLIERVRQARGIRVFDRCFAIDLLRTGGAAPRALGAVTWHPRHGLQIIWARATVLASGGAGQVFRETTNPRGSLATVWPWPGALAQSQLVWSSCSSTPPRCMWRVLAAC